MKTLVIYHSADLDGLCSREIAKRALGDTATYLGWDYGQPVPNLVPYDIVYLIDISLPRAAMALYARQIIWIDHHKSAIEDMKDIQIGGYRIDGVAACRLAWQWFFGDKKATKTDYVERKVVEPYAVQLLGEHDIWNHTNPDTLPFQYGMQSDESPDWKKLFETTNPAGWTVSDMATGKKILDEKLVQGRVIAKYLKVTQAQLANEAGYDADFEGLKFRVLNTPQKGSMQFDASIKEHHDGCLRYYWNGETWGCSLYGVAHKKDVDLSVIAKKYGGGGHKSACGCTFKTLPKELGGLSS
jgi:hypothetical protein